MSEWTVAAVSPLTIRERADAAPLPAKLIGGTSYVPVVGARVLVAQTLSGRLYVIGSI